VQVHYPEAALCTDNGAMIALAAAMRLQAGVDTPDGTGAFEVRPRWPLDTVLTRTGPLQAASGLPGFSTHYN
jgi:N6-L-threonylcarbamoyladenine synthase